MKWKSINPPSARSSLNPLFVALILTCAMLAGCQSAPPQNSNPQPSPKRGAQPGGSQPGGSQPGYDPVNKREFNERMRPWRPRRATVALDTPAMAEKSAGTPLANGGRTLWYSSRNDRQVGVISGYETATHSTIVNQTYDRQGTVNGQPRDIYYNRTYRSSIRQTVR